MSLCQAGDQRELKTLIKSRRANETCFNRSVCDDLIGEFPTPIYKYKRKRSRRVADDWGDELKALQAYRWLVFFLILGSWSLATAKTTYQYKCKVNGYDTFWLTWDDRALAALRGGEIGSSEALPSKYSILFRPGEITLDTKNGLREHPFFVTDGPPSKNFLRGFFFRSQAFSSELEYMIIDTNRHMVQVFREHPHIAAWDLIKHEGKCEYKELGTPLP